MIYIGIDPGASGGIVILCENKVYTFPMPSTDQDVLSLMPSKTQERFAVLERNTGYVGGAGNPGSAMFKFGISYGALRMALTAAWIPFEEVMPAQWQRALKIPPRKRDEAKGEFKNRLKAKAQQLFPGVQITLKTADALLIAEFCRRKREGTL